MPSFTRRFTPVFLYTCGGRFKNVLAGFQEAKRGYRLHAREHIFLSQFPPRVMSVSIRAEAESRYPFLGIAWLEGFVSRSQECHTC